jgi:o-succinylbenzoate---CoA ligase
VTTTDRPQALGDVVRSLALRHPDGMALLDQANGWTWSELDRWSEAIAAVIAAAVSEATGQGSGRVGLALGQTAVGVVALHGIARTGNSAVLVHPRLSAPEVTSLLERANCRVLVVDPAIEIHPPAGAATIVLDGVAVPHDGLQPAATTTNGAGTGDPTGELIVPTSGTTARPRLARLPFDRVMASASAWNAFLPPATGWLLSLGLAHVAGIGVVARAAQADVPVVVPSGQHPDQVWSAIASARERGVVVSHVSLVATQLERLLDSTDGAPPPDGLRAVILGGGPIPEALLRRALDAGWPVIPSYGLTESASGVVAAATSDVAAHMGTVGRPLLGAELRIDDDGRIGIRGPMVFDGYLDDEPSPGADPSDGAAASASTTDGWLATNDHGRLDDDGRLTVLGRLDDVIISGGEKIAPAEVEAALLAHPGIADVGVVGAADPTWGSVPVAVVVVRPGSTPSDDELRDHARARLADFKVPARFVRVDVLPRTDLGKIIRPDLVRLARTTGRRHAVTLSDGQVIAVRDRPATDGRPDAPVVVLLHATLATAGQLTGLARRLTGGARVLVVDRRGSGESRMASPAGVDVERHATDILELLDRLGIERAALFGHSFGGVVALRATVRAPERIHGLVVWEPPYLVLADRTVQAEMRAMTDDARLAFERDGPAAAARLFLDGVAGVGAWERLGPRQRDAIDREGPGVLADIAMAGLTADGLDTIDGPVVIATGGASVPFYRPIADALAARIGPNARRVDLADLGHPAPITDPDAIAALILENLQESDR